MELEELKSAWQDLEKRLERQEAISFGLFAESRVRTDRKSVV